MQWWLPMVGARGLSVYVYVASRANSKSGRGCFESVENMARALGLGVHNLRRTLRELVRVGLLDCDASRQHFPNVYRPILPVPIPNASALTKTEPLDVPDLPNLEPLKHPGLTKSNIQGSQNRKTNRKVLTESITTPRVDDTRDMVAHLYAVLERMNGESPAPNYGRDAKNMKRLLVVHSAEHVRAKVEAFARYWPSSWIAKKGQGLATPANFWTLYNEIPTAATTAPVGTKLSDLETPTKGAGR